MMPSVRAGRAHTILRTVAAVTALVTSTTAQRQFDALPGRALPAIPEPTFALAGGDVDGDGDVDLVCGTWNGQDRLFLNRGDATFFDRTPGRLPIDGDDARCVVLGDIDNDGDLDLLVGATGYASSGIRVYRNDGTGVFTDVTSTSMPVSGSPTFAAGDLDNDGDLDLVGLSGEVLLNNSSGVFTMATPLPLPAGFVASAVALGDIDNDGDLDVVLAAQGVGQGYGQERLYRNNGPAGFTDITATNLPPLVDLTSCLAFVDADGDADLDIVTGNWSSPTRLLRNDGTGSFTDVTATQMPVANRSTVVVVAVDVDADGDADLVLEDQDRVTLLQNSAGTFVDATPAWFRQNGWGYRSLLARDLDQDGRVDLVRTGWENHVYVNDGSTFHDGCASRLPEDHDQTWALAIGDVDGDGDLDVVSGNWGQTNRLTENRGDGTFTDATATHLPPDSDHTRAVALGDVDGDGDLDAVFGNSGLFSGPGEQNRLYLNNGLGVFADVTATNLPAAQGFTWAIALADLDQDGDLDVLCGGSANWFWRNDGTGVFSDVSATHLPPGSAGASAIGVGDLDGDGDRDLVLGGPNRVYRNNGLGFFADVTATSWPTGSGVTYLQLGDVDVDGDLDVVGGNWNDRPRLYRNNGAGSFTEDTAASMPFVLCQTTAVALADLDGDGDLDLAVTGSTGCSTAGCNGDQRRIFVNDGAGVFTDATAARLPIREDFDMAVVSGDVDGDGDADLLFGSGDGWGSGGPDQLYLNLQSQLDTPYLLRVGRPYTLEVYSRYGPGGTLDLAIPWLSTTRWSVPLPPFGTLGIDPMAPLPLVLIPQPAGVAATAWSVPNVPSLAGVAVHAQALLLRFPLGANLTNVTSGVLIR